MSDYASTAFVERHIVNLEGSRIGSFSLLEAARRGATMDPKPGANLMRIILSIIILAVALVTSPIAGAQTDSAVRSITVIGQAQVQATPDRARVNAGVVSQAKTATAAVAQNSAAMQGVFDVLKRAGIAEADVRTGRFRVAPMFDEVRKPRQVPGIVGYQVSNTVTALVRDTNRVGDTLDALIAGGANTLNEVSFFVAHDDTVQDTLRVQAVKDARRKAAMMADAAGATLGPVLTIVENGRVAPVSFELMQAHATKGVPVAAGTETLSTNVSVTFELR
jgi:uncharacterized protein YggE